MVRAPRSCCWRQPVTLHTCSANGALSSHSLVSAVQHLHAASACLCARRTVTNASRTNLMDLATLAWHEPFLDLFGAPASIMPRIVSNAEVYGAVAEGPLAGVPIAGGGTGGQGRAGDGRLAWIRVRALQAVRALRS
jgi:hypothetical protein